MLLQVGGLGSDVLGALSVGEGNSACDWRCLSLCYQAIQKLPAFFASDLLYHKVFPVVTSRLRIEVLTGLLDVTKMPFSMIFINIHVFWFRTGSGGSPVSCGSHILFPVAGKQTLESSQGSLSTIDPRYSHI
jgi:hypothetical protein